MPAQPSIAIVIPTYGRDSVLVQTVEALLGLPDPADQLIVVDQTQSHDVATDRRLGDWADDGAIRWVRRETPSITAAMNAGLNLADTDCVLFLDDDIRPYDRLVTAHRLCIAAGADVWASVGQVIQPWQEPQAIEPPRRLRGLRADFDFPFHSTIAADVSNVMAGNLCVRRTEALEIGAFDENYLGVAYRFETDFARRLNDAGGRILFCPEARIDHLRVERGGTRQQGNHLASADPIHGVGDYYYAMRHADRGGSRRYMVKRMLREVCTKFHLRRPWWIPVKLCGEIRAWRWARQLHRQGPKTWLMSQ